MTTETEARSYRHSTAIRLGNPMTSATTTATAVYATFLALGAVFAVAGTMFVLAAFPAGTGPLLVVGALALGVAAVLLRPRVRSRTRPTPRPRRAA
jgi:membrane protein implicated in regulation of membrane protease activity